MKPRTKGILCVVGTTIILNCQIFSYIILAMLLAAFVAYSGFSSVQAASIFSAGTLGSAVVSLFFGFLYERFSPKLICGVASFGALLLYGSMALTKNLMVILVCAFFWGMANTLCGSQNHMVLTNRWFKTGNGTIISTAIAVGKVVQIFVTPLIAALVLAVGFKNAALGFGIAFSGAMFLSAILLTSRGPKKPEDQIEISFKKKEKAVKRREDTPTLAMGVSQLMKLPIVYLALATPALISLASVMFTSNMSLIYKSAGLDLMQIGWIMSLAGVGALIVNPLYGILSDLLSPKKAVVIYCIIGTVTYACFPLIGGITACVIIALTYGVGNANIYFPGTVMPPLVGKDKSSYMIGWSTAICAVTATVAPLISSSLYASTGSYALPLGIGAGLFLCAAFATIYVASNKSKKKILDADKAYKVAF